MGETILKNRRPGRSYHDSVEEMLKRIREDGMSNVFDRYALQENPVQVCIQGLSCRIAPTGPAASVRKGARTKVCAVSVRTPWPSGLFCSRTLWGQALTAITPTKHTRTLRATGEGKTPFGIKDGAN